MTTRTAPVAIGALVGAMVLAVPVDAASFDVPLTHPTLQAAVAAASASPDVDNEITISASPVLTNATVSLGAAFGPGRQLVIRPADDLGRASIVNNNPVVPIIEMLSAGNVTLQDLDILRDITNGNDIVYMSFSENILIERCRIGSHFPSTGTPGWANVHMLYPTDVLLRNNVLFSNTPGTFDFGINAESFNDPANSLRLYNNDISDYRIYGVRIEAAIPGPLVLSRNNVVANHPDLVPEPFAYRTDVLGGVNVVSSHNVAFATAGFVQSGVGQDIAGLGASFLTFGTGDIAPSFVDVDWAMVFDANPDFFRLADMGPLHDDVGDYGMTVVSAFPDIAVEDDIEHDIRPGGDGPHTDRGADQIESGATTSVSPDVPASGLLAVAMENPAGAVSIAYTTRSTGRLELEVFDLAGRRLHAATRAVDRGTHGAFSWDGLSRSGVVFYRLRLEREDGGVDEATGRVAVVR